MKRIGLSLASETAMATDPFVTDFIKNTISADTTSSPETHP
jgi:hypothetical protein